MAQRTGALEAPAVEAQRKSASLWGDAFRRLLKNRLAVVGAIVVFILLILAIVGPYLTPFEYQAQDYAAVAKYAGRCRRSSRATSSAPTSSGVTCSAAYGRGADQHDGGDGGASRGAPHRPAGRRRGRAGSAAASTRS